MLSTYTICSFAGARKSMNVTNANVIHLGISETLTEDEQSLLGKIPTDVTYIGIRKTRRDLGWDDERIWKALQSLAEKNIVKIGPGLEERFED